MTLSTILTTLIITSTPDLCADVYVDVAGVPYMDALGQTWSRFCEWTGPSAPTLDLDVCCTFSGDTASCTVPNGNGRCASGVKKVYCEYGEVSSAGVVDCYQPWPSVCEFGFCGDVLPPDGGPWEDLICCWGDDVCTEIEDEVDAHICVVNNGYSGYCKNGALNVDGTIECFD